jgi:hypothetical protein
MQDARNQFCPVVTEAAHALARVSSQLVCARPHKAVIVSVLGAEMMQYLCVCTSSVAAGWNDAIWNDAILGGWTPGGWNGAILIYLYQFQSQFQPPFELTCPVWWVQDDLVQELRLEGRRQAQQRLMRQKREHVCSHSGTPDIILLDDSSQ